MYWLEHGKMAPDVYITIYWVIHIIRPNLFLICTNVLIACWTTYDFQHAIKTYMQNDLEVKVTSRSYALSFETYRIRIHHPNFIEVHSIWSLDTFYWYKHPFYSLFNTKMPLLKSTILHIRLSSMQVSTFTNWILWYSKIQTFAWE